MVVLGSIAISGCSSINIFVKVIQTAQFGEG
jgi:hypothetical protein